MRKALIIVPGSLRAACQMQPRSIAATAGGVAVHAFHACMERTLGKHIWKMLTFDLPEMITNIDARAGCYSHLTREEAEESYEKNRGWQELFGRGRSSASRCSRLHAAHLVSIARRLRPAGFCRFRPGRVGARLADFYDPRLDFCLSRLSSTASLTRALNAVASTVRPSRMSIALRVPPRRLALNSPAGSSRAAPCAKVSLT